MGTRNLTIVRHNGENVIAQYGQWDGFPSGTGLGILEFLHHRGTGDLLRGLSNVEMMTPGIRQEQLEAAVLAVGKSMDDPMIAQGFIDMEVSDMLESMTPETHRNTGFRILYIVADSVESLFLENALEEGNDSISWCEWVWVVNLDDGTLDAYNSYGTSEDQGIFADNPFSHMGRIHTFSLETLPSGHEFMSVFEEE